MYGIIDGKLQVISNNETEDIPKKVVNSVGEESPIDISSFSKQLYLVTFDTKYKKEGSKDTCELRVLNFRKPLGFYDASFIVSWRCWVDKNLQWEDKNNLEDGEIGSSTTFEAGSNVRYEIFLNDVLIEEGFRQPNGDIFDIKFYDYPKSELFWETLENNKESAVFNSDKPSFNEEWIHISAQTKNWELIVDEKMRNGVSLHFYTWPLVTEKFCKELITKAEEHGNWTTDRHNNYPTHDLPLKSFGYEEIYHEILEEYAHPVIWDVWRLNAGKDKKKRMDTFIAKYDNVSENAQNHLGCHHDQAEYTLVLTLNDDFEGGGTWFPNQKILLKNPVGYMTLHPNTTHRHGARPVLTGTRYVLISFVTIERG